MTSQWLTNGFIPSLCISRKLFSIYKAKYKNRFGEWPLRSWRYLICIISRGLCSYNARLFNDDIMAIGVSYRRTGEFPNYARLHRGKMYNYMLSVSSQESWVLFLLLLCSFIMCANNRIHYGPMVVFVCLHFALPHCNNYADVSEGIGLLKYLSGTFCRVCV